MILAPNWLTPKVAAYIDGLYGASREYALQLVAYADKHGWKVSTHPIDECLHRLTRPSHHCNHDTTWETHHWLDHALWLHRGFPQHPTQWALLSQPYESHSDDPDLHAAAEQYGARLTIEPDAPYGSGTWAVLLEGVSE